MKVGKAPIAASPLILGCMRMAQLGIKEAEAVIKAAQESQINFFDHADIYGKGGASEIVFAQALKQLGVSRDAIYLQSKCGIREGYFDFSKEHLIQSTEGILQRLQTDYLDVLLLHRPDALMEPAEVAEAFDQLYQAGKVRYFGVSNQSPSQIALLQSYLPYPLIANQLQFGPAHTPMIDAGLNVNMRNAASIDHDHSILDYCRMNEITIQAWSPFQVDLDQGIFMAHPAYQALRECLQVMALEKQVSFEALVLAWILRHPAQMQVIVGSMNPERILNMGQATSISLSRPEWYQIYRSAGNQLP